jgi:hypothetical protein
MLSLKDICCERKSKDESKDKSKVVNDDDEEIEELFNNITKLPSTDEDLKNPKSQLPQSGLKTKALQRLKIEFRFMKRLNGFLQSGESAEATSLISEYYSKQLCKVKDSDSTCNNQGWCSHCSSLMLLDNMWIMDCISDIFTDNFKFIQQITIMVNAPKGSAYEGKEYQINIDIPDNYPKAPLSCFLMQPIKHINIE